MSNNQADSKEASHVFLNIVCGGQSIKIIDRLVFQYNILDCFYNMIRYDYGLTARNLVIILTTLKRMFELERIDGKRDYYQSFEYLGGVDELENQQ